MNRAQAVIERPVDPEPCTFERDFRALTPQLKAFACNLMGTPIDADDLVQNTLIKAWAARATFKPGSNLKAWLFMIMRNHFYTDKRRSWRVTQLDQDYAEQVLTTDGAMPEAEAKLDWKAARLHLLYLVPEQRDALVAVGHLGFSYDEAASIIGVPMGTVKSRVSRGRKALAELMKGSPAEVSASDLRALHAAIATIQPKDPFYPIAQGYRALYCGIAPFARGHSLSRSR